MEHSVFINKMAREVLGGVSPLFDNVLYRFVRVLLLLFSCPSLFRKKSKREEFSVVRIRGPDMFISDEQSQPEPFRMLFREICILEIRDVLVAKVSRSC